MLLLYATGLIRFTIPKDDAEFIIADIEKLPQEESDSKPAPPEPTVMVTRPDVNEPVSTEKSITAKEPKEPDVHKQPQHMTVADSVPRLNRLVFFTSDPFVMQNLPKSERAAIQDSIEKYQSAMQFGNYADSLHPFEMTGKMDPLRNPPQHGKLSIPRIIYEIAKAMRKRQEKKPVKLDFIPSDEQLQALNIIWRQELATELDIYAQLDKSTKLMMTDLNDLLEELTEKGILARRMVSPRNEFTLSGIPLFEMNPLNRKNRMYQYTSRITATEMITFLNAKAYQAQSDSLTEAAQQIQRKALMVIK